MTCFIDYFNCGSICKYSTCIDYTVVKQEYLLLKFIPFFFFFKHRIVGKKYPDYLVLKKSSRVNKN